MGSLSTSYDRDMFMGSLRSQNNIDRHLAAAESHSLGSTLVVSRVQNFCTRVLGRRTRRVLEYSAKYAFLLCAAQLPKIGQLVTA